MYFSYFSNLIQNLTDQFDRQSDNATYSNVSLRKKREVLILGYKNKINVKLTVVLLELSPKSVKMFVGYLSSKT